MKAEASDVWIAVPSSDDVKLVKKTSPSRVHLRSKKLQESLADAKVSARQQCVYEGP